MELPSGHMYLKPMGYVIGDYTDQESFQDSWDEKQVLELEKKGNL